MRFKSNGFTLVEVMVAAAVGVTILLGIATAITSMAGFQAKSDTASDASSITAEIVDSLKSGSVCTAALAGQILPPGPLEVSISIPMDGLAGPTTLRQHLHVRQDVAVESLQLLKNPAVPAVSVLTSSGVTYQQYLAILRLTMSRTTNGMTSVSAPVDIPLKVLVDPSQAIKLCNTDTSTGRVCVESGGTWDPAQPVGSQCIPKTTCEFAGGYSEALTTSGGYVNEITGAQRCPTGFTAVRSGATAKANRCGKYCIGNTYTADFTCVKCGSSLPVVGSSSTIGGATLPTFDYSPDAAAVTSTSGQVGTQVSYASIAPAPAPAPYVPAPAPPAPVTGGGACFPVSSTTSCTCTDDGSSCASCSASGRSLDCSSSFPQATCFIGGTQVTMGDNTLRSIEEVKIGDQVLAYNEKTNSSYVATVTETLHHPPLPQDLFDVYTNDGHNFVANGVHWIYVVEKGTYLPMKEIYKLFVGRQRLTLVSDSGKPVSIAVIRNYQNIEETFNLHVSGVADDSSFEGQGIGHNYFAGGVLVHNMYARKPMIP